MTNEFIDSYRLNDLSKRDKYTDTGIFFGLLKVMVICMYVCDYIDKF